jgi:hypothetical protein
MHFSTRHEVSSNRSKRRDMDGSAGRSEAGAGASRIEVTPLTRRAGRG